ncbi:hypothetical protein [Clostridium sp.]|uniref:hypothetical protein n=1 Tax=Clostridium sp. TaxID=1506 RepID=UPI002FC87B1A
MKESIKEKMELVVQAGMQCVPVVGSPLASLYFGNKQNKRFKRIEDFYREVSEELESVKEKIVPVDRHNEEELSAILEDLNDRIENEHINIKRELYKTYFKNTMINPVNNNYDERKLLLDIINQMTPLQIELIAFLNLQLEPILNINVVREGTEKAIIQGSIGQLKNLGLINSRLNGIVFSTNSEESGANESITISELGKKFHKFCMEFNRERQ